MALEFLSPLHKAIRRISIHLGARPAMAGMEGSAHLLTYLVAYGPCTVGRLHRVFGFKPSTLTSMLDRLEKRNLAVRTPNPEDRRSFLVEATAEGRRRGAEIRATLEDFERRVRDRVDPEDLEGFRRVLDAIGDAAGVTIEEEDRTS